MTEITLKRSLRRALLLCLAALLMMQPISALAGLRTASDTFRADPPAGDTDSRSYLFPPSIKQDFSLIRVLISIGDTTHIDLDLECGYTIGGTDVLLSGALGSPVKITVRESGGTITITDRTTGEALASGPELELQRTVQDYEAGYLKLTDCAFSSTLGRYYLGNFKFCLLDGVFSVINTLPMAYYIFGIVGYELNPYCFPEALKAQALISKTYSMYYMDSHAPYDVKDGFSASLYQHYRGYKENRLSTMQYCLWSIGHAMTVNGTIVPTFYTDTNGGETGLPSHAFGENDTVYDPYFDVVTDDIEFENEHENKQLINVDFGGVGDSSRFRDFILGVIRRDFGETAVRVVSISELNCFDPVPGTQRNMRQLHVRAKVECLEEAPDPTNTPAPTAAPTAAPTDAPDPTAEPDAERGQIAVEKTFSFDCGTSLLKELALSDYDGSGDDYSAKKYVFDMNLEMYWGIERENGYTVIYARHGLGVGMSHQGANIRANPETYAQTCEEILEFYYPKFEIVPIIETDPLQYVGPLPEFIEPVAAYGICTQEDAPFRAGPSSSAQLLGKLGENEHLDIYTIDNNGWFRVRRDGVTGYIHIDYVRVIMFPSPADGLFRVIDGTTRQSTRLRAEPYVRSGNSIATLPEGTRFTTWARIGKWYYAFTEDGLEGFLSGKLIQIEGEHDEIGVSSLEVKVHYTPRCTWRFGAGPVSGGRDNARVPME